MGLSRRDLGQDEEIIVEVRSHKGPLLTPFLLLLVCLAGAGAIMLHGDVLPVLGREIAAGLVGGFGIVFFLVHYVRWRGRSVALTTERVVVSTGSVRSSIEQVRLARIIEVHRTQTLGERLCRRGSVVLEVHDAPALIVDRLRRPESFQRLILRQLDVIAGGEGSYEQDPPREEVQPRVLRGGEVQIIHEDDPTPPTGTPAVSGSRAETLFARLDELDRLEASGALSRDEADRRRRQLTD